MIVVDKKKYKMAINEATKELHIQVHGLIREEDAEEYISDLHETMDKVSRQDVYVYYRWDSSNTNPVKSCTTDGANDEILFFIRF